VRIGVCGVACEKCPRMVAGACPSRDVGCVPKENKSCAIATCAFRKGVKLCFECEELPCETTKTGPISMATVNTYQEKVTETRAASAS